MRSLAVAAFVAALAVPLYAANPIQIENAKPGTTEWMLYSDAQGEIEGYASSTSVTRGEAIRFYVNTIAPQYTLNVYRVGWYSGQGARKVHGPVVRVGFRQTIPTPDPVTGLVECNWTDPYTVTVGDDWTTGVYLVKLSIDSPRVDQYIPFVVRDDVRFANHNFQLSVTTWQAYNNWGGKSLYGRQSTSGIAADKVSFNRPFIEGSGTGQFLWRWEYNMVRFLEREGYDVNYTTNFDTHLRGPMLANYESFLSVGHDEYWSSEMRDNVESALNSGVDLGFFSANTAYWQVRFEPSTIDGEPNRTMVGYKEDAPQKDPFALDGNSANDKYITMKFRDAPVSRPESALLGVQYGRDPVDGDIVIDNVTSAPWVFENTGLVKGSKLVGLLGYEVDAVTQFSPAGIIKLGTSPYVTNDTKKIADTAHMTIYQKGGAWVFATGSIQWSWGLDDWNSASRGSRLNPAAQQMTRNLLRRFAGAKAANDCQFRISPASSVTSAEPGSGTITLTNTNPCAWNVTSSEPWLRVTSPPFGTGSTNVAYEYDANTGATRTATLTIADKTFTLTQSGCGYSLNPGNAQIGPDGGPLTVVVTAESHCPWTASSNVPWIIVTSGANSQGNGSVNLQIASVDGGPARTGSVTIAGKLFTVQQSTGCTYQFSPEVASVTSSAGVGSITVTASSSACAWTATTNSTWLTITGGATGSGNGTISYSYTKNTGPSRDAGVYINGIYYNVYQANGCSYSVSPSSAILPANGGDVDFTVSTESGCFWKSSTNAAWVSFLTASEGQGPGTIRVRIQPNTTGATRTGRVTIASINITITQSAETAFGLTATANGSASVSLSWATPAGATTYEVQRSENGGAFVPITSTGAASYVDAAVQPRKAYVYRIRATGSGGTTIGFSTVDVATTFAFTDATLAGVPVKAVHFTELREAANALRAAAGLAPYAFTGTIERGGIVRAVHIQELRTAINQARTVLALPPFAFSESPVIRAVHVEELRTAVR